MITFKTLGTGSSGNAYILTVNNESILLEAGLKMNDIIKLNNYTLQGITDCLISHKHKDHSKAIKDVFNSGIAVTSNETVADDSGLNINKVEYNTWQPLKNRNFVIYPVLGFHDTECTLYKIFYRPLKISFAFIIDTESIPINFNSDYYFVECNFDEETLFNNSEECNASVGIKNSRVINTHLSLENIKTYFNGIENHIIKSVVLLHQSKDNASVQALQSLEQQLNIPVYLAGQTKLINL